MSSQPNSFEALGTNLSGRVATPDDAEWDSARQGFNLAVDQRPAAVVLAADERDVVSTVRFAAENGLRVAAQATGHGAVPRALDDAVLLRTTPMRRPGEAAVEIDAERRTARAAAGAVWGDVLEPAAAHGLAALHGSSPTVGVAGYTLGGGTGWYARAHGLQCNSVTAIELISAEGEQLRADPENEPELFWALRGGGGNFGVVTAIEFELFPVGEIYAGMFLFDWERSAEVLGTWNELLPSLPDELTSLGRILQVPDMPEIPEMVRGGKFAGVEAALLGSEADGAALLEPLRALGPDIDTFAMVPAPALGFLHMDPPEPAPAHSGGRLYNELPAGAIEALVAAAGPGSGSPLVSVEIRHTGGALARSGPDHGALDTLAGSLAMYAVGIAPSPEAIEAIDAQIKALTDALEPHEAGLFLNFADRAIDLGQAFPEETLSRLQRLRSELDPGGLFAANHEIAAA